MLSDLISNLPGMVYRCEADEHWTMKFVTEGCLELTGYHPSDLIDNARISYDQIIHRDDRAYVQQTVQQAITNNLTFELTYRIVTASGQEKWVWERGRNISLPLEPIIILEGYITDISERVMAQQQLEQRVVERTRQLSTLIEIQRVLSSRLDPDDVMQMIAEEARLFVGADFGALFVREDDFLRVTALAGHQCEMKIGYQMPVQGSATGLAMQSRKPIRIDYLDDPRANRKAMEMAGIVSMIGVPLVSGNATIGVISLGSRKPAAFSQADEQSLSLLAPSATIAMENAQLYARSQEIAAYEERQRLARDLHDAVTQTLFSASMIADVLPRLWERHPEEGRRRLEELRQLTRGALAEMRTLLLELRPTALVEAKLSDLLRQLGDAVTGRARVPVSVTITGGEHPIPSDLQVAYYRIAQEALNNVVKHAGSCVVAVHLTIQPNMAFLRISDDGRGFTFSETDSSHFGLRIMRERATAVGAELKIESKPGLGTVVTAMWEMKEKVVPL